MNYLHDRRNKRKKVFLPVIFAVVLLILFYFRGDIYNNLSYTSHKVFRSVFNNGNNVEEEFSSAGSFFTSKGFLYEENKALKALLSEERASKENYDALLAENLELKEILGRKTGETTMVLSAILGKPNQSPYDTLIIDVGENKGVRVGDRVFALGNIPIGRIEQIYPDSSKVILFSNPGEQTRVEVLENIFLEAVGRGGGNFEMVVPQELKITKGEKAILPGITPYVLGVVETTVSDPRDLFTKAILASPVNIQELKFVQVEFKD